MPWFKDNLRRVFPQALLIETINAEEAAAIGPNIVAQKITPQSDDCGRLKLGIQTAAAAAITEKVAPTRN